MIDGEGHVEYSPRASPSDVTGRIIRRGHTRRVVITNTSTELIRACEKCCVILGIDYVVRTTVRPAHWATVMRLVIGTRSGLEILHGAVTLRHPVKRERLARAVASFAPRRPTVDVLRALCAERGSQAGVAAALGVSKGTVQSWLCEADLPTRLAPRWPAGKPRKVRQ
jgi:hypothetical protein